MPAWLRGFLWAAALGPAPLLAGVWTVRVEEPTGIYRRNAETIAVPIAKLAGHRAGFTVTDASGAELPWQLSGGDLLFPASVMPGDLPEFKVSCCDTALPARFTNQIVVRRAGQQRIEFGNRFFRGVIDTGSAAIIEMYSLRADEHRRLNLVETTPEGPNALKGDVHENTPAAAHFSPPPVKGVDGPNTGWSSLGGEGPFTHVELTESGPLRGKLLLTRRGETWEIVWTAGGPWFRWKARRGFRFTSISASPYVPFNRCLDGSEYSTPTGPGEDEPAPHEISDRGWSKLPGGHMVYYQREENYGALGIVAIDEELRWSGAGTRRFQAVKPGGDSEIAVTFPQWNGADTMLEARREYRALRQPLLVTVSATGQARGPVTLPAARDAAVRLSNTAATPFRATELQLDGDWELAFCEKGAGPPRDGWRTVQVPGTAHVQWLEPAKLYTREAEWVSSKEWWYRKRITVPASFRARRARLEFEATDYYADTFWNGVPVGRHEGYIDPYEFDVTRHVRIGESNELIVRVWTPVTYYWKHRPYTIKGAYGAVDQKPDDITPLGITRPVRLKADGEAAIRDVAVNTRLADTDAEVELDLEADNLPAGFTWEATLSPRNFSSTERIQARIAAAPAATRLTIPVKNPRLWWTWEHGQPNLYTLDVRLLNSAGRTVDGRSLAVGIREIEKIGWDFYLNRKRMFIRGTNYYSHLYMSEMKRASYERDLNLMLGMNVNMVRLHCHFTNREFYDLADERGVLIWQDFLEAWYPHGREFALRAAALYDNHIRYARNHPSIALWATSDEEDFENYRELTKHLAPRAFWLDPQRRPVVRSTGRFGDSHVYHGWYDGSIWQYTHMTEQFVSELGATALPNLQTLTKYMPGLWPIRDHADEWRWRRLQIPEAMRAWGDPGDTTLEDYIPRTQAYVSRLFQIAIGNMRRRKWQGASGILHFHAIDIWPSVTMAAIDFDRVPTKTYETVQRSFAPVGVLFEYDRDQWKRGAQFECGLWVVNDLWRPVPNAKVSWTVTEPGGGTSNSGSFPVSLSADSVVHLGSVRLTPAMTGGYELHAAILDAEGTVISENAYEFRVVD